jgi:hydrogenase nickel incorporation protein HypA/HybF
VHELSIAHALARLADERAAGAPVLELTVEVGELAGVVPDSLRFAWEVATAGTSCEGAELVVRPVPVVVHCTACGHTGELAEPMRFRCARCAEPTADIRQGRELHLVGLLVATEEVAGAARD